MSKEQQLVHEILGKRYILVDVPFITGHNKSAQRIVATHGLLYQGIKTVQQGGLLSKTLLIQTYFCPEENYLSFTKDEL